MQRKTADCYFQIASLTWGVEIKVLDDGLVVSEFELQSCY